MILCLCRNQGKGVGKPAAGWILPLFVIALLFAGPGFAHAAGDATWHDKMFQTTWDLTPRTDEILLQYAPEADSVVRASLRNAYGLELLQDFNGVTRVEVCRVPAGQEAQAISEIVGREYGVAAAVPAMIDQEGFTKYYIPGRVTVQFRKDLSPEVCLQYIADAGSAVIKDLWTPGYYTITVPEGMTVFQAVRIWQSHPQILFSEPHYMMYDDAVYAPNDPYYDDQWHLNNTGAIGVAGSDIDAEAAWDLEKGDPNVIISIIDTGMDMAHEDLAGNLLPRGSADWDFSGAGTVPNDTNGHGTSCSGLAAGIQDNGIGVSGVAPGCRLMPLKVSLNSGENDNRADAINYAVSRRPEFNGMVISCSWRMSSGSFTAVEAACQNAWDNNVVMLVASGNDNSIINYPALYPTTIAVGASSPCDERKNPGSCDGETWWGSNYGPELDVVSPGVLMTTTDISGSGGYTSGNYVDYFNGTSSATPVAAGVCGLILSANPNLTNVEVRQILRDTAEDQVGPANEDGPGFDNYFGWGRINAYQAVLLAMPNNGFEDDMEAGEGGWTHQIIHPSLGYGDDWHLSQQRNHTPGGQNSWKCGATSGDYSNQISAALISPSINVSAGSVLRFWHWMDVYAEDDEIAGDGGVIEVSSNGGATWQPLIPAGGYTHRWAGTSLLPFFDGQRVWSGSFDWRQETVFLTGFSGSIQIRFRLGTRGADPTGEGWYVDDVEIVADPSSVPDEQVSRHLVEVLPSLPNPATGSAALRFQLAQAGPVSLVLHDISGRVIRQWDLGSQAPGRHQVVFDGFDASHRPTPAGVYLYRVVTKNEASQTGRLVWVR